MGKTEGKKKNATRNGFAYRVYSFVVIFLATLLIATVVFPYQIVYVASAAVSWPSTQDSGIHPILGEKINAGSLLEAANSAGAELGSDTESDKLKAFKKSLKIRVIDTPTERLAEIRFRHSNYEFAVGFLENLIDHITSNSDSHLTQTISHATEHIHPSPAMGLFEIKTPPHVANEEAHIPIVWLSFLLAAAALLSYLVALWLGAQDKEEFDEAQIERELKLPVLGSVFPTREKPKRRISKTFLPKQFVRLGELTVFAFICLMLYYSVTDSGFGPQFMRDPLSAYLTTINQNFR